MAIEELRMPRDAPPGTRPPVEMITPRPGLVYKARDNKGGKVFFNAVEHELVGRPLDAAMVEVSDEHLDLRGIGSLRVPLDVGDPFEVTDKSGEKATAFDVIFSPAVISRAKVGRMAEYYQRELGELCLLNAQEEMGKRGLKLEPGVKLLNCKYKGETGPAPFPWVDPTWAPPAARRSEAAEGRAGPLAEGARARDGIVLAEEEVLGDDELRPVGSRPVGGGAAPAAKTPVVKKGFLSGKGAGKLYENADGTYGSTEQSGPKYDHVDAQLSHLPKSLRDKCAVVDTTKLSEGEVQDAMQQYAATGRVTSGPAAPGGLARTDPKHKEAFDSMFRKGPGAGASAPEKPTFALGFGGKDKGKGCEGKAAITELAHELSALALPDGSPAQSLAVSLPAEVSGLDDLDVEVSALKVEVKSKDGMYALNLGWPQQIDPDAATAKFRSKTRRLLIVAPVA